MATETRTAAGGESLDEERSASPVARGRTWAFYVAAVGTLALALVVLRAELVLGVTGWVTDLGIHQVHDVTLFSMLWIALLAPLAAVLYRPRDRVTTVLAPVLFLAPLVAFAALADSPILALPVLFGVLSVVVLVLHPAGRDLLRFDRVERVDRLLAALLLVAAVPLLVYAGDQTIRQLTIADEHAAFAHYGAMALASVYVVVMGALAIVRRRDWRFAAYSAGVVAVVVGAASVVFTAASSVGPLWGGLAVAFGVGFVAAVEYRRRSTGSTPEGEAAGQ